MRKRTQPHSSRCQQCRKQLSGPRHKGVAYLSSGSLLLKANGRDSIHTDRLRAFLHVGHHGSASDMSDSANVTLVDDLADGQFDFSFCSISCLDAWFKTIVKELRSQLRARAAKRPARASPRKSPTPRRKQTKRVSRN